MFLNIDNPVYNTIIIFSIIMLLLYTTKPDVIYDNEKNEFRQFGTTDGKTLLPIYIVGMLLAIILYVFFYYITQKSKVDNTINNTINNKTNNKTNNNELFDCDLLSKYKTQSCTNNYDTKKYDTQKINNRYSESFVTCSDKINKYENNNINDESYKHYIQQQIQLQNMQNQLNQLVVQQQLSTQTLKNKLNYSDAILPNCLNI